MQSVILVKGSYFDISYLSSTANKAALLPPELLKDSKLEDGEQQLAEFDSKYVGLESQTTPLIGRK